MQPMRTALITQFRVGSRAADLGMMVPRQPYPHQRKSRHGRRRWRLYPHSRRPAAPQRNVVMGQSTKSLRDCPLRRAPT